MKCRQYKCKACCCYNIPFENGELERFKDRIVNPIVHLEPFGPAVVPFTAPVVTEKDLFKNKCPFLRKDYKCNIYENRPDVCRKFGAIPELPCKFIKA